MNKSLAIIIALCFLSINLFGQSPRAKGDQAWEKGKYKTAINNYSSVENILEDKSLLAKRGLGYFKLNKLKRAINDFTLSRKLGNNDPELFYLMAQAKQHLNQYEEAAFFYKEYIKEEGTKNFKGQIALREIKNCAYSAFHQKDEATAFVETFGSEVNTYYDELYPLQSPKTGNIFYFSSNRNLKDNDVYAFSLDTKGNWEQETKFEKGINTDVNEYVMDISSDAQAMLFTRNSTAEMNSKIYVSAFDEEGKQHVIELPEYLLDGAVDLQIVDRNTIAFASKEIGGLGGYDIFLLHYKNGVWSDPKNAGEVINSEYDERSPYFASTSEYLYFSSNRPYSFGGYDVYYYNILGIEEEPMNMGKPLNSSGNDLQFRLSQDGQMAVMSSDRKTGEGAYDIYQMYMMNFKPMPPRDMQPLEYVQDYFNSLKPKKPKEKPKSHLDKLKEKIEKEEPKNPVADEVVKADPVAKEVKQKSKKTKEPVVVDANKKDEPIKVPVEVVEEKKQEPITKEVAQVDPPKKTAVTKVEPKPKAPTPVKKETKKTIEKDLVTEETKTAKPKKPKKIKRKKIKDALPEKESGESPLKDIKQKRKSAEIANIAAISGENIKNSILYQDRHDLKNDINKDKLDQLVDYLKSNLDHTVHFVAHTDHLELGLPEFMQYNTLKRANLLASYLTSNGVGHDRITIESVCANYPLVKPEIAGKTNEKYLAYNKRVDWEIRDGDNQILQSHNINTGNIPGFALDRKYELYTHLREEVYYSIEIAKSPRIHKNAVLRLYSDIYIRKNSAAGDNYYYIGFYNKHEDAVALKADLEKSSAGYAKIVAFYNGQPIQPSQLANLTKDYPDLKNYKPSN